MALTYANYIATIANLTAYDPADPNFVQIMPSTIDYAEDRIYREADLLATVIRDSSTNCTANSRDFNLPTATGTFDVVKQVNIITPAGTTTANGTRVPLTPVNTEVINNLWPSEASPTTTTVPQYFAMFTDTSLTLAPAPGGNFNVEVIGTVVPTPLSVSNPTTYLTQYLPDLFIAASMVFMNQFMKNIDMMNVYEGSYQSLFKSADLIDARQRFAATSWSSAQPEPYATNQRG